MANFTDTFRGDGLARVHTALAGLEGDSQRLGRARIRFDDSPQPYISERSGTTTRSVSPNPPSEEQRHLQERRVQLGLEREASLPYYQFEHQTSDEEKRISESDWSGTRSVRVGDDYSEIAYENVKERWVEQGILNNKWNKFASGRWKHEEPLELESESEFSPLLSSFLPAQLQPKARRQKSDKEKQWIAERRTVPEREREASRPYHQFFYQISKERERVQDASSSREGTGAWIPDINTVVYEHVKSTWTKRGIWSKRWGILPGMSWKHEMPIEVEEESADAAPQLNPVENGSQEAVDDPLRKFFGRPITNLSDSGIPSPVEANQRQVSGFTDLAGSENGDAERSPPARYSFRFGARKRVIRPTKGHALVPGRRSALHKDRLPAAKAPLGPVHPSKVSKAAGKRDEARWRMSISQKVSSDGLPSSSSVEAAEPKPSPQLDRVTPRKSKWTQPTVCSIANDQAKSASIYTPKRAVRSKPEVKGASNPKTRSSTKPQGISKREPTKTQRKKTRIK